MHIPQITSPLVPSYKPTDWFLSNSFVIAKDVLGIAYFHVLQINSVPFSLSNGCKWSLLELKSPETLKARARVIRQISSLLLDHYFQSIIFLLIIPRIK